MRCSWLLLFFLLSFGGGLRAQLLVKVSGVVKDDLDNPLPKVTVSIPGQDRLTVTDEKGIYHIYAYSTAFSLKYTLLGYNPVTIEIRQVMAGRVVQDVVLISNINELEQVKVTNKRNQLSNTSILNVSDIFARTSVNGNFESLLKTLPGVSVNNELSAQYSVRGGNFDENLVYVNDVQVGRPVLIRNGQQEGLSFINSDLLTSARFSAGGFEAKYDDKLSSVLDVRYDRPDSSQASLNVGFLGATFASKILSGNSYLMAGLRYKNNATLLGRQDNKGSYSPNFTDAQLVYQYNLSGHFFLNFLGSFNGGSFRLIPDSRETKFGTLNTLLRLQTVYQGEELDDYQSAGMAVSASWFPKPELSLKWINSYFHTLERERIDIEGRYQLSELSIVPGNPPVQDGATGGYTNYAHNNLKSQVFASEFKATQNYEDHVFFAGLRFEHKSYHDDISEYSFVDSAGVLGRGDFRSFYQDNFIRARNGLFIEYLSGYVQDSYRVSDHSDLQLGLRANFNTLSRQLLLSPRLLLAYRSPGDNKIFRFMAGVYQQAPDYRSIRDFNGSLVRDQLAQRSYNTSVGLDYAFDGLSTRLKFTSELYYRYQDRLVPYMMDNVRIRYLAGEQAKGNIYGLDMSIGGEFVKDLVSYFRLSLMKANQKLAGDDRGYLKRPTDQRVNVSVYFQDRLLNSPSYKVHLNLMYGSKMPLGAPLERRYSDSFSIPAYKRVDIGFSRDFLDDLGQKKPQFLEHYFSSFAAYLEVFNLLNINNTVSYLWLKDVNNVQYGIPNYLTSRQLNLKLIIKFKNSNRKDR